MSLKTDETKLKFVNALSKAMQSTALEKVRVTNLCDMVSLSRATFYENFRDIFDVPNWYWDYLLRQSIFRMGKDFDFYEAHVTNFRLLQENQDFFSSAFKSTGYNSVCQHGGRVIKEAIINTAEANTNRTLTDYELLQIDFYIMGASHMTQTWARTGMIESPETMSDLYQIFVPEFLVDMLKPSDSEAK